MEGLLESYDLLDHLKGFKPCSSAQLLNQHGELHGNPDFVEWQIVDKKLRRCLLASVTNHVYSHILFLTSFLDVWLNLEKRYNSFSRAHMHQLKNKLASITKRKQINARIS